MVKVTVVPGEATMFLPLLLIAPPLVAPIARTSTMSPASAGGAAHPAKPTDTAAAAARCLRRPRCSGDRLIRPPRSFRVAAPAGTALRRRPPATVREY